jgi:hypothetical protein
LGTLLLTVSADEKKDPPASPIIIDSTGKEIKLNKWKLAFGTRKVNWIEGKPDAFEFRENDSTTYKVGVITLVPLQHIKELRYDSDTQTAELRVDGLDDPLTGSTKYKDVNAISIEAEIDLGTSGIAEMKYRGGVLKGGIRCVQFPNPKPAPAPKGNLSTIRVNDGKGKSDNLQLVANLQALYKTGDAEVLSNTIMFRKTVKMELGKIDELEVTEYDLKTNSSEAVVKTKDKMELTLTLLPTLELGEGKTGTLIGFVGQVPAGYKLFPLHTIGMIKSGDARKEPTEKKDARFELCEPDA